MDNKMVGFSSVSNEELMNVDGGAIHFIAVILIACVSTGAGIGLGYYINK